MHHAPPGLPFGIPHPAAAAALHSSAAQLAASEATFALYHAHSALAAQAGTGSGPTAAPTSLPTSLPPTPPPTYEPTYNPSYAPSTYEPSSMPTETPTYAPSYVPTDGACDADYCWADETVAEFGCSDNTHVFPVQIMRLSDDDARYSVLAARVLRAVLARVPLRAAAAGLRRVPAPHRFR